MSQLQLTGKWLRVELEPIVPGAKTTSSIVFAREGGARLGRVSWYSPWRRYVFAPEADTIFEEDCLRDIATFVAVMTEEQRAKWKGSH